MFGPQPGGSSRPSSSRRPTRFGAALVSASLLASLLTVVPTQRVLADPAGTALQFDGTNDYVTFGPATSTLGTSTFTLEAWVKRASGGATMTTGSLGFDGSGGRPNGLYPVLTKGMGEGEGPPANINTNWFLGITSTGVIGADFEDTAGGVNHRLGHRDGAGRRVAPHRRHVRERVLEHLPRRHDRPAECRGDGLPGRDPRGDEHPARGARGRPLVHRDGRGRPLRRSHRRGTRLERRALGLRGPPARTWSSPPAPA